MIGEMQHMERSVNGYEKWTMGTGHDWGSWNIGMEKDTENKMDCCSE